MTNDYESLNTVLCLHSLYAAADSVYFALIFLEVLLGEEHKWQCHGCSLV